MGLPPGIFLNDPQQNQPAPQQDPTQQQPENNAQNAGPVKAGLRGVLSRMLGNFSYGAGQAMLKAAGDETDAERATRLAQTAHLNAQTQLAQSQAQMMQTTVPVTLPNGAMVHLPPKMATDLMKQQLANQGKTDTQQLKNQGGLDVANANNQNRIDLQSLKNQSPLVQGQARLANASADLKDAMNDPTSPAFKLALQKVQWSNYFKEQALNNQNRRLDFQENGPTSQTRTQGQMAQGLLSHVDSIKQQIADLGSQGKLGPLAGRFNEFMAGKVGSGDPDYTALRTNLGLFQTALMKAHVGARGSEMMMQHFHDLIDSGKMTPESLDSAMNQITGYLNTYVRMGKYAPPAVASPSSAPAPVQAPSGNSPSDPFAAFGGKKR